MKKYILFALLSFLVLALFVSCEIDHGLYPIKYTIKGKVLFFKGEPPPNTDRVEVFALKEFPPKDPQNFLYLGKSGALDYPKAGSEVNEVEYEIPISRTSYQMIVVLWKEKNQNWDLTGLMGFYTGEGGSILPDSVFVTKEIPVVDSVDINANWEVVSKDASISGKITYEGDWPKDTQLLLLAVYRQKPTSDMQFLLFENVNYTQPVFVDTSSYRLAVGSGVYNYVVLYWVGKKISKITDLIALGYYESPENPGQPGKIEIASGERKEDVHIHVNFNAIQFP
jgi:hypothetical protein